MATILVGDDPASATYVKMKGNACRRVGMDSLKVEMNQKTSTTELLDKIDELNNNEDVHGFCCNTLFLLKSMSENALIEFRSKRR
nr:MAG: hypothetical protein CM15mP61_10250 [Gammaproteobacteria bacterium]